MPTWSVLEALRENPGLMRENLRKRFMDAGLVDKFIEVDGEWRRIHKELDEARHRRNLVTREIPRAGGDERKRLIEEAKRLKQLIDELEVRFRELQEERLKILKAMPSLLHPSVPVGPDESYNAVIRVWGKALVQRRHLEAFLEETEGKGAPMEYEVTNRELVGHADMLENVLGLGDTLKAGEVAGSRFYYLFNDIVWLDFALLAYAVDYLTSKGYRLVLPPYMLKGRFMRAVEEFEAFKDALYKVEGEDLYLIATAEHPLAALHAGESIPKEELPLLYVGVSPCFRREAGAANRDLKGIFRVHQFHKVEQFAYTLPEDSWRYFDELIGNAEELFRGLGIPHRVVNIASGELNLRAAMKYDLEAWYPAQGRFRELVSCSNVTDWQAFWLKVRYRARSGETEGYVHMLNSTAIASTRTITAILENFQDEEGCVEVPKVLRKYLEPFRTAPKDRICPRKKG